MKKVLSFVLAFAMLAALVCVPMSAADDGTFQLLSCDTLDAWTPTGGPSAVKLTVEPTEKREGSGSIRMDFLSTGDGPFRGLAYIDFLKPVDMSNYAGITMDVYIGGEDISKYDSQFMAVNLCRNATVGDGFNVNHIGLGVAENGGTGWRTVSFPFPEKYEGQDQGNTNNQVTKDSIGRMRIGYMDYDKLPNDSELYILIDNIRLHGKQDAEKADPIVLIKDQPAMVHDGESLLGTVGHFGAELSVSNEQKTQGENSIKMVNATLPEDQRNPALPAGQMNIKLSQPIDTSNYNYFEFDMYIAEEMSGSQGLHVTFGSGSEEGYASLHGLDNSQPGWKHFKIDIDTGGKTDPNADITKIDTIRFRWFNYSNLPGRTFYFDNFQLGGIIDPSKPAPVVRYEGDGIADPHIIAAGDKATGWSGDNGHKATVSLDTEVKAEGSVKVEFPALTADGTFGGIFYLDFADYYDFSNYTYLEADLYASEGVTSGGLQANLVTNNAEGTRGDGLNMNAGLNDTPVKTWKTIKWNIDAADVIQQNEPDATRINRIRFAYLNYRNMESNTFYIANVRLTGIKDTTKAGPNVVLKGDEPEPPPVETPLTIISCDTLDGWKNPGANANVVLETEIKQEGAAAIKQTYPNEHLGFPFMGYSSINFYKPADFSNFTTCSVDVYIGGKDLTGIKDQCIQVNFAAPGKEDGFNHSNIPLNATENGTGWRTITFPLHETPDVEASWDNIGSMRIGYMDYGNSDNTAFLIYDNIRLSGRKDASKPDPKVMLTPDKSETPCVVIDCEDEIYGWTTSNDVELSLDKENKTEGEASVKYYPFNPTGSGNPDNPIGGIAIYTFDEPIDMTNYTYLEVDIYVGQKCSASEGLQITTGSGQEDGYNHMVVLNEKDPGWFTYKVELTDGIISHVNPDLTQIDRMRFMWLNYNFDHEEAGQYFLIDNVRLTGIKDPTLPPPIPPTYPVTGKVLPGTTGAEIAGITVGLHKILDNGNVASASFASTKTDAEGNYKFAKVQDGDYAVRIKAVEGKYDLTETRIKVEGEAVSVEDITLNYTAPAIKYGDVTGEGEIDSVDALAVLKHIVGDKIPDEYLPAADTYKDGAIDSNDSLCILQYCVGIEKELPVIPAQ